ncbi:MAG: L-rhamnose mutarotase [Saprospiraceae bacterium]|nr:L-rhamnose mutarotase [Saprospiraceae bacterium]
MRRVAFTMKLKPGFAAEYERRHDEIWPELRKTLSEAGISDYSIFLDKRSSTLFAVHKVSDDFDPTFIPENPVVKQWWLFMADIMETNRDHSPVTEALDEVFHMD